jgi:hypothetical protein
MPDLPSTYRDAGFSDAEISDHMTALRSTYQAAGFTDQEIDAHMGVPATPQGVPQSMLSRFMNGTAVGRVLQHIGEGAAHGFGEEPVGPDEQNHEFLQKIGVFAKDGIPPLFPQKLAWSTAAGVETLLRAPGAAIGAIAGGIGGVREEVGGPGAAAAGQDVERDTFQLLNAAGLLAPAAGPITRIRRGPTGQPEVQSIGVLPKGQDFADASTAIGNGDAMPKVEAKLADLYDQKGIHPAEVAHDAQADPTVAQSMLSSDKGDMPAAYGGATEPPEPPAAREPPAPSYGDAERQILSKISIDEKAPERALTWDGLYTGFIDKLFPIAKAVKEADLPDLTAENNPYQLARLMAGYAGKADHFLNNGTFDFATYENNGPSLKSILRPVAKDLNGFRAYAAASRALELEGRGVESGFNFPAEPSAPPLVSSGLDAARTVVAEGRDKYEKPFRDLVDYQNRVGAYLRDSGVLSANGYKAMVDANKMYVPFSRVMGLDEGAPARGGSSLQAHNPIKAIKGSARDIVDPVESVVRNTFHMIEMAERNVVGTKLVDMLQAGGKAFPEAPPAIATEAATDLPRQGAIADALGEVGIKKPDDLAQALAHAAEPEKPGQVSILRDGKRETYSVDPELARAMKGLDAQSMSMLERALAFPASTLRAGAVSTPEFWGRHVLRDFLYATTTFKDGVFSPIDMGKGFAGLIMKDEDYWNWLKGGGGNISSVGIDRRYLQDDLRKLTGQTGLAGRAWNVLADPEASMWDKAGTLGKLPFQAIGKFVLDPLRAATQFAENASHLAAFKKSMRAADRAEPEATNLRDKAIRAAWVSRDTAVDAARMGANMRAYNLITAFANIKLQDSDRVVRAIRDNPVSSLVKIGAAITVPSVALWAANHNDPRYAEIPQWQKDMFWLIMTPDHVFRIPKPWAMGMVFGTLPERLLDQYVGEKPDAFKNFFTQFWKQVGPDFLPTAAAPIVDQFANRSTFTNRTLIPSAQEKFLPEYQYTPYTTELTKSIGQLVGAFPGIRDLKMDDSGWGGIARAITSPILMENYIRGWTGTLGIYALNAADAALRKQGILPDPPQPTSTLADIPIIRAFVIRYPSASAESIQDFYDNYERNKSYFTTFMAKAKDGDVAATQHIVDMGGPAMFMRLDAVEKTLNEHSKLVQDIYKNPQVPPAEKRQLIDQLYASMIEVARSGNEAIRTMQGAVVQKNMLPAQ